MRRGLYRLLLSLHPGAFRRQFAEEMLGVFDEAEAEGRSAKFCSSAAWSVALHWVRHPMLWKIAGGLIGGVMTLFWGIGIAPRRAGRVAPITSEVLMIGTVAIVLAIALILIFTVAVFRTLKKRRV